MKAYGGVDVYILIFLTLALVGGEWSGSLPGRFTPGTHWIGGWVDPRAGLDDVEKITDPTGTRTPTFSVVQPVASRYTDCALTVRSKFRFLLHVKAFKGRLIQFSRISQQRKISNHLTI
jgi:hypothetical protein